MIILQAGHVHIGVNCDTSLRSSTGAPGEVEYTEDIALRLKEVLWSLYKIQSRVVDANFNCSSETSIDYTAVIALHCQGDTDESISGFGVSTMDPATDGAADRSKFLADSLRIMYGRRTELQNQDARWGMGDAPTNANCRFYYLAGALSQATPFALIEMGNISGADRDWLEQKKDVVVGGIATGIALFTGQQSNTITSTDPILTDLGQSILWVQQLKGELNDTNQQAILNSIAVTLHDARRRLWGE